MAYLALFNKFVEKGQKKKILFLKPIYINDIVYKIMNIENNFT